MRIKLLKPIKSNGEIIQAGVVVKIDSPETAEAIIRQGIGQPVDAVMNEMLKRNIQSIDATGRWKISPELRAIEEEVDAVYVSVIAGRATLTDFRAVVARWRACGHCVKALC